MTADRSRRADTHGALGCLRTAEIGQLWAYESKQECGEEDERGDGDYGGPCADLVFGLGYEEKRQGGVERIGFAGQLAVTSYLAKEGVTKRKPSDQPGSQPARPGPPNRAPLAGVPEGGVARHALSSPCIPHCTVIMLFALGHVGDHAGRSFFLFRLQHVAGNAWDLLSSVSL